MIYKPYLDQFSFLSGIANEQVINIPEEGRAKVEQILETIIREGNSKEELKDDFCSAKKLSKAY